MESGYACFCGNNADYWKYGEAASTECNSVCFGDLTQPCGGDGRIILFDSEYALCSLLLKTQEALDQGNEPAPIPPFHLFIHLLGNTYQAPTAGQALTRPWRYSAEQEDSASAL